MSHDPSDDTDSSPELIIGPARKGAWGVVKLTSGPPDGLRSVHPELLKADGLLRTGMLALIKRPPRYVERAEACFREALELLTEVLDEPHPRISFALDRIGLCCHMRGHLEEAEGLYRRSLAILGEDGASTEWTDMTLINLAVLLGTQGRRDEQLEVMKRYVP